MEVYYWRFKLRGFIRFRREVVWITSIVTRYQESRRKMCIYSILLQWVNCKHDRDIPYGTKQRWAVVSVNLLAQSHWPHNFWTHPTFSCITFTVKKCFDLSAYVVYLQLVCLFAVGIRWRFKGRKGWTKIVRNEINNNQNASLFRCILYSIWQTRIQKQMEKCGSY